MAVAVLAIKVGGGGLVWVRGARVGAEEGTAGVSCESVPTDPQARRRISANKRIPIRYLPINIIFTSMRSIIHANFWRQSIR